MTDLIYDMAQMMECVASSISRWLGCKAEYYLLSCSTLSDVRRMDDRHRGSGVYFPEAATNTLLPQAQNRGESPIILDKNRATFKPTKCALRQKKKVVGVSQLAG
jgi:hypothetical protein